LSIILYSIVYYTIAECRAGRYGLDCTLMCHCEDKAKTCDHILGCTDCNDGWGGDQCKSDIDECSDALANNINICPTNSNVSIPYSVL